MFWRFNTKRGDFDEAKALADEREGAGELPEKKKAGAFRLVKRSRIRNTKLVVGEIRAAIDRVVATNGRVTWERLPRCHACFLLQPPRASQNQV